MKKRAVVKRDYLPTIAQLIDRLSIVTLKSIKIPDNKKEYEEEARLIMKDIDRMVGNEFGQLIRAVQVNMLANETIWQNESKARLGGSEQDKLLKFTHTVNGVRTLAMNVISNIFEERKDLKVDSLAAELCKEKGYDFGGIF